jgi:hypothetical protein
VARLERDAYNTAVARLEGVAADDSIGRPVRAFQQDVGLDRRDDLGRRVLVEDDDGVDR